MTRISTIGIIGSGDLGGAIATALLESGFVTPEWLWIGNRSGRRAGFEAWPGVTVTTDRQALADACDLVLLAVPPDQMRELGVDASGKLVVSVMAGVTLEDIAAVTGAARVVRAMSSPAARLRLAYSPWIAASGATTEDKTFVGGLFSACGETDEISEEGQIDVFTAITGPVPGFVAFFAEAMAEYARANGVDPSVADRAVRQLFYASGMILRDADADAAQQVQAMIDYAGTTAAGLTAMRDSEISELIHAGLDAARDKARTIARVG
jgi:pyrroline-5-carboxylate reductase